VRPTVLFSRIANAMGLRAFFSSGASTAIENSRAVVNTRPDKRTPRLACPRFRHLALHVHLPQSIQGDRRALIERLQLLHGNAVFQLGLAVFGIDEHQAWPVCLDVLVRHHAEGGDDD